MPLAVPQTRYFHHGLLGQQCRGLFNILEWLQIGPSPAFLCRGKKARASH